MKKILSTALLLPAGVKGVGVARQRLGIVGNGDAGVGVTVVDGHDLHGDGRFPEHVVQEIWEGQQKNLKLAFEMGVHLALGSDAGAYRVLHGQGLMDEYQIFRQVLEPEDPQWESVIQEGDRMLKAKF